MESEKLMDEVTTEEVSTEVEYTMNDYPNEIEDQSNLPGITVGVVGTLLGVAVYKYGKPVVKKIIGKFRKSEPIDSEEASGNEVIDVEVKD